MGCQILWLQQDIVTVGDNTQEIAQVEEGDEEHIADAIVYLEFLVLIAVKIMISEDINGGSAGALLGSWMDQEAVGAAVEEQEPGLRQAGRLQGAGRVDCGGQSGLQER